MKTIEQVILCSSVAVAVTAWYFIIGNQTAQIERQAAANPKVFAACKNLADKAHGLFSTNKEIAVMEECLLQRDPTYAAARLDEMCRQAKAADVKPEIFTDNFRKSCFGNS